MSIQKDSNIPILSGTDRATAWKAIHRTRFIMMIAQVLFFLCLALGAAILGHSQTRGAVAFTITGKQNLRSKAKVRVQVNPQCTLIGFPSLLSGQEQITLSSFDGGRTWASSGSLCVLDLKTYKLVTGTFAIPTILHAHAQAPQKPAESIVVPPDAAQEIRQAYEQQENARLVYVAAQAKAEAAVWKAKAKAKCPDCTLTQNAQGQLVLTPDPPKEVKSQ